MPGTSHEGKERQMPLLRSLSAGMLVLLLVGILAACGGSPPEAQQPTAVPAGQPTAAPAVEPTAATSAEQPTAAPAATKPTAATVSATSGGILNIGRPATPDSL